MIILANLCDRFSKWVSKRFGVPPVDFWADTWAKLAAWEAEHSNKSATWNGDPYGDRIREAFGTWQSSPAAAFQIYLELAALGSAWSMREVGRCYAYGRGIDQDRDRAEVWLSRSADAGYQLAVIDLARLAASRGDFSTAEAIVAKSAAEGWTPACFWSAWYRLKRSPTRSTYAAIRPMLESAANDGHPVARALLARYMAIGKYGIRQIPTGLREVFSSAKHLNQSTPTGRGADAAELTDS